MKSFTAILAVALGFVVCGAASAQPQDLGKRNWVAPTTPTAQDLRNPDQVAPAPPVRQDLRNPDQVAPTSVAVPQPVTAVAPADGVDTTGGLGALWIVLIAIGGAAALAGAGYATVRYAHAHGHPAT